MLDYFCMVITTFLFSFVSLLFSYKKRVSCPAKTCCQYTEFCSLWLPFQHFNLQNNLFSPLLLSTGLLLDRFTKSHDICQA